MAKTKISTHNENDKNEKPCILTFPTQFNVYSHRARLHSASGSRYKKEFVLGIDENGCKCLKETGLTDMYAKIQSHRASCDLQMILSTLDPAQVNGAMSTYSFGDLLNSEIVDITKMPRNAGEYLNLMKQGQEMFAGLPLEVREEFNFSAEKFVSSFGTKDFKERIDKLNKRFNRSGATDLAPAVTEPKKGAE